MERSDEVETEHLLVLLSIGNFWTIPRKRRTSLKHCLFVSKITADLQDCQL